jgi:hypothetical protein
MSKWFLFLPNALRTVSAVFIIAMTARYITLGSILLPSIFITILLLILSCTYSKWPRITAALALVSGIVTPALVFIGYRDGNVEIELVIVDCIVFAWITICAMVSLVRPESLIKGRA